MHRPLCVLFAAVVALVLTPPTSARQSNAYDEAFADVARCPLDQLDATNIARLLALDDDQRAAADLLFEGFFAGYANRVKELRVRKERVRDAVKNKTPDELDAVRAYATATREFVTKAKGEAQATLFTDLKSLLTPGQLERWPAMEQFRRRQLVDKVVPFAATHWGRVPISHMIEREPLIDAERASVAPLLAAFELELDEAMLRYHASDAFKDETDLVKRRLLVVDRWAAMELIAKVNRRHARIIVDALPPEAGSRLDRQIRARAYPGVYSLPTPTPSRLDSAERLVDLDADQRNRLAEVRDRYERESARLERRGERLFDEVDALFTGINHDQKIEVSQAEKPVESVWAKVARDRETLELETTDRLREILTPGQRAKIK